MIRATTGGVLRSYRANLMSSFIRDNKARDTVLSQRVFNSYAEDPASAAKAFRLRKSRLMASSQLRICGDTYHKFQAAFASLQTVDQLIDTENGSGMVSTLKDTTLRMLNDPTGDAREQLNKVLDNLSDTIIQMMNQTYGDEFIFAGADGYNVPFTIKEEGGVKRLYYRDVPVDAHVPEVGIWTDGKTFFEVDETGAYGKGYYIRLDMAKLMSKDDFDKLNQEPPTVVTVNGDGVTPQEFNDDGTRKIGPGEGGYYRYKDEDNDVYCYIPIGSHGAHEKDIERDAQGAPVEYNREGDEKVGEGGYYRRTDLTQDEKDANVSDLIKIDEYNEKVANYESRPQTYVPLNEEGNPIDNQLATQYLVFDPLTDLISKEDYEQAVLDAKKLEYLANEKRFVDIGLGFKEDPNGEFIESSGFNECLSGLTFLGYGLDEDGDPRNIYSIVQRLKEIAGSVSNENWGTIADEFDRMVSKLEDASSEFKTQFTNQSAGTEKLKNNYDMLEENVYDLKTQYSNLEDVNMADAISSFIWAEYCYNAALKVGNSILSQSLMDYLS